MIEQKQKYKDIQEGYKDTEVGRIPVEWDVKPLGQLYPNIRNGFVGTATPFYVEKGVKYLQGKNIKKGRIVPNELIYVSEEFHEKQSKSQLKTNDLVMVQSGHVGECAVVTNEYNNSNCHALIVLSPNSEAFSPYYSYLFNSNIGEKFFYKIKTGNTVEHILASDMKKLKVPVPSYDEQKKISSILLTWDKSIELYEKLIEQKKEKKKGIMQKLLTGEKRLPGFEEQWESTKLSKCLKIINGYPFKSEFFNEDYKGMPLIRVRDIKAKELKTYYSGEYSDDYIIKRGDVIIGMDGEFNITMWNKSDGLLNQRVMKIIANKGYDLYFLYQLLIPKLKKIEKLTPSTTVKHLSNKDVNGLKVQMPTYAEQQVIGKVLYYADREIVLLEEKLEIIKLQKKGLMQLLLTGKVRVKV